MGWDVREVRASEASAWAAMRTVLWPEGAADHADEVRRYFDGLQRGVAFVALDPGGTPIGFAEATIRHDCVNGTDTSPVGFLEGWFVLPEWRGQGAGRALVDRVAQWTREQGCVELASDALLDNVASHRAHAACGFEETERVVCFRKLLAG